MPPAEVKSLHDADALADLKKSSTPIKELDPLGVESKIILSS